MPNRTSILIILTVIFSAGVTPIVIRITQNAGMPSLVIVFIRLWLITFLLFPLIWTRHRQQLMAVTPKQWQLGLIAGFWLAINLFMLFLALEYTSVLMTSVLRRTTPLWILAPEVIFLGAVATPRTIMSLVMTFGGVVLIALGATGGLDLGSQPLIGAGMALFGAICFGIYLLLGRRLNDMPSLLYSWIVFVSAAIVTTIFLMITRTPVLGYPPVGYLWTLLVTFLAQVLGHMVINLGLQRFSATAMSIILQVGVVLSAVIAAFLFNEIPTTWQLIGSALVIVGVVLATIDQSQRVTA